MPPNFCSKPGSSPEFPRPMGRVDEPGRFEGTTKNFALGLFVGVFLSCGILIPLWQWERHHGLNMENAGNVKGRFLAARALEKEFGRVNSGVPYNVLFSVKTTDVVSIETNGIRTVRVIP